MYMYMYLCVCICTCTCMPSVHVYHVDEPIAHLTPPSVCPVSIPTGESYFERDPPFVAPSRAPMTSFCDCSGDEPDDATCGEVADTRILSDGSRDITPVCRLLSRRLQQLFSASKLLNLEFSASLIYTQSYG